MNFEPVIGLEIHAQISTKSKMFCGCDNDSFNKEPNSNTCPICMGFPGTLPVINRAALEKGITAALALNCGINEHCKFDRKNYFYPDLPSGYQISQYDQPLAQNGQLEFTLNGKKKVVRINRLHLENDAGKLTHTESGTLCDYNRAGTPLMEIVSEADIRSPEEARLYAEHMQKNLRAVSASDCDMEKGMMRFDINVSIRPVGQTKFGTKAEVKNLNSFKALEKALIYEIKRQIQDVEEGRAIIQETRGFDQDKEITFSQRSKEEAHDYRYFPEPDLPPILTDQNTISQFRKNLPELPEQKKERYMQNFGLKIDDAELFSGDKNLATLFEKTAELSGKPDKAVAWITTHLLKYLNEEGKNCLDCQVTAEHLSELINVIDSGVISHNTAKEKVFPAMYKTGKKATEIIKEQGLQQVTDIASLETVIKKVLADNPESVSDYKAGKTKAIGFLIGQVMKATKGQGSPAVITEIVTKLLAE